MFISVVNIRQLGYWIHGPWCGSSSKPYLSHLDLDLQRLESLVGQLQRDQTELLDDSYRHGNPGTNMVGDPLATG